MDRVLMARLQQVLRQESGAYWTRSGWLAFAVDGTRIEAPHTLDCEQGLGIAGRDKSRAPGVPHLPVAHGNRSAVGLPAWAPDGRANGRTRWNSCRRCRRGHSWWRMRPSSGTSSCGLSLSGGITAWSGPGRT